jgi:hypothetical protein
MHLFALCLGFKLQYMHTSFLIVVGSFLCPLQYLHNEFKNSDNFFQHYNTHNALWARKYLMFNTHR